MARRAERTRSARWGLTSLASSWAPVCAALAARSAALPPGPAHRSSQRASRPSTGACAATSATSWLPSSSTPARQSRIASIRPGSPPTMTTARGLILPGRGSTSWTRSALRASLASASGAMRPGLAHRVTSGSALSAARSASSSSPLRPWVTKAWRSALTIHSGCDWVRARAVVSSGASRRSSSIQESRSRPLRRRMTALTKVAAPRPQEVVARSTVVLTAACWATRMPMSWWAPRRRTSSTAGSMRSSGRSVQAAIIAS